MASAELIALIQRNDKAAKKQVFETFYGKLAAIAGRYAKNQSQADEILNVAFNNCFNKLQHNRHSKSLDLDLFFEKEFILECVMFIKSLRSEYYVSSTVYAVEPSATNYDLFANNEIVDFNHLDAPVLVRAIQQLAPSQRMIFNLHVIDGYTMPEASLVLEANEETIKSNLEKARYNLQKNIEQSLKKETL